MAATLLGSDNGIWGINDIQPGFILNSSSQEYTSDEKSVKNISGDDTGLSHYNERINGTLEGFIPADDGFSQTISTMVQLATAPANHLVQGVSGGSYVIKSISTTQSNEEYQGISLNYTYHPKVID